MWNINHAVFNDSLASTDIRKCTENNKIKYPIRTLGNRKQFELSFIEEKNTGGCRCYVLASVVQAPYAV